MLINVRDAFQKKQAEKLKSRKMVKDEGWMMKDEGWMMKVEWLKLLRGFDDKQTEGLTDICECRVAFVTENLFVLIICTDIIILKYKC